MIRVAFRRWIFALTLASSLTLLLQSSRTVQAQAPAMLPAQAIATIQQQYQVAFLQDNASVGATFLFTTDTLHADNTTSGTFTANVEGNLLQGRFLELNLGGESLWVAQAAGPQVGLLARGWKTQDRLVGQGTVSLANNGQIFRENFFLLGQGVISPAQAPVPAQPPATPSSAQPNTGPNALDARPSSFAEP